MKKHKLYTPEKNVRYSFRMPNGKWHSFAYYGTSESGRLLFINTTYGTMTSMTPARFSFLFSQCPKTVSPYVMDNVFPESPADPVSEQAKPDPAEDRKRAKVEQDFKLLIHKLRTMPIDVEDTIRQSLHIEVKDLAEDLEKRNNFNMTTADCYNRLQRLLNGTPYALPII